MRSSHEDAAFFGLDSELDAYMVRLEAAKAFAILRRDIDRNLITLKTLTLNAFGKRRTKDTFRRNVEQAVTGGQRCAIFTPLIDTAGSTCESSVNLFILSCFTLSHTAHTSVEKHNLTSIFVEFLACVVRDCVIFPEMRNKFVAIIREVCEQNPSNTGKALVDTIEGIKAKRRRLNRNSGPDKEIAPEDDKPERLIFDPQVLSLSNLAEDTDVPPDHIPKKVVFQFVGAMTRRLEQFLQDIPLLQAMKTSQQWRWERNKDISSPTSDEGRTDTIVALIPDSQAQDISLVIKVGHRTGKLIIDYLGFQSSPEGLVT
ncbi:hypothetical protein PT974_01413 [Cladobotryum mycophilum]|uniref:Uncharacterized protein n=1 Tax=Cladobotryum mycophilum TaxID=491253 RepID=A0ABR0T3L5_9HYPO